MGPEGVSPGEPRGALCQAHLRLGQAERRGQLHPLRRGQVALDLEPLLQTRQLRVGEHGARFAAAAVLPGQLGVRRGREQRGDRHPCGQKAAQGAEPGHAGPPRSLPLSRAPVSASYPHSALLVPELLEAPRAWRRWGWGQGHKAGAWRSLSGRPSRKANNTQRVTGKAQSRRGSRKYLLGGTPSLCQRPVLGCLPSFPCKRRGPGTLPLPAPTPTLPDPWRRSVWFCG